MSARTFDELFDPEPAHLAIYETDGQFTVINIAEASYPRMILPTERHLAAAWALAYRAENPATVLDRASFMVDPHSRRVDGTLPERERGNGGSSEAGGSTPVESARLVTGGSRELADPTSVPSSRSGNVLQFRRRPLEPLDEEIGRA